MLNQYYSIGEDENKSNQTDNNTNAEGQCQHDVERNWQYIPVNTDANGEGLRGLVDGHLGWSSCIRLLYLKTNLKEYLQKNTNKRH